MTPELRPLTELQLRQLYREHVARDFPPAERRPLSAILRLRRRGDYDTWGVFDGDALAAYAFLWRGADCALLDYLAVCRDARGQGYGTRALELVKGQYGPVPLLAPAGRVCPAGLSGRPVRRALRHALLACRGLSGGGAAPGRPPGPLPE